MQYVIMLNTINTINKLFSRINYFLVMHVSSAASTDTMYLTPGVHTSQIFHQLQYITPLPFPNIWPVLGFVYIPAKAKETSLPNEFIEKKPIPCSCGAAAEIKEKNSRSLSVNECTRVWTFRFASTCINQAIYTGCVQSCVGTSSKKWAATHFN